jgi:Kef-type K+ transport system membrane component KefB
MPTVINPVLAVAVMLIAAFLGGYLAKWLRMPRIVGYILVGAGLQLAAGQLYGPSPGWVSSLGELVNTLALGMILFTIGRVFERRSLHKVWQTLWRLSLRETGLTFLLTWLACFGAAWTLPGMELRYALAIGLLLAMAAIATAPAATLLVLQEYSAKGPTTDHLLGLVGINNLVSTVGFALAFVFCAWLGWIETPLLAVGSLGYELLWITLGSVALGAVLGLVLSWLHARVPLPEMILLFFAVLFLLVAGDDWLRHTLGMSFNSMVACLVLGGVFANFALDAGRFEGLLETIGVPIYALFFVFAGYNLHFSELFPRHADPGL